MTVVAVRPGRWLMALLIPLALAACGGGGTVAGSTDTSQSDGRNGDYTALAANGQEYVLNVDFDRKTYRMSRDGFTDTGAIGGGPNEFFFAPTGALVPAGTTARFVQSNDAVIGGFPFPGGVLPIVAPRAFYKTLADGAGVYNFVTRTVDTPAAPAIASANTAIFQGQLATDGKLRTCNDATVFSIADCPAASVTTGTVTIAGDVFTSTTPTGAFPFRIARIGSDKVFLRASVSSATARRFWIGMPATTSFAAGSFLGANTDGNWSATSLSATAYSVTITPPAGATVFRSGTARAAGAGTLASLLQLTTPGSGLYFAVRSSELAAVVAAQGSTAAPGYLEIGKHQ
jgi:hypothetical protein